MTGAGEPRRAEVWIARLDPVEGSEQAGTRPVLGISSDRLNRPLPIVTVAVMTSRKTDRVFPTEVPVEPPEGGLRRRGKVLLYQIRTVDKTRLSQKLGVLTDGTMGQVQEALSHVFELRWWQGL